MTLTEIKCKGTQLQLAIRETEEDLGARGGGGGKGKGGEQGGVGGEGGGR